MQIGELIRRWQAGQSGRRMAASRGSLRNTVGKYLAPADAAGIAQDGLGPTEEELCRLAAFWAGGATPRGDVQ